MSPLPEGHTDASTIPLAQRLLNQRFFFFFVRRLLYSCFIVSYDISMQRRSVGNWNTKKQNGIYLNYVTNAPPCLHFRGQVFCAPKQMTSGTTKGNFNCAMLQNMTRKKKLINFGVSPILTINKVREKRSNVAQNLRRTCTFNHKAVPTIVGRLGKKY